MKVAKEQGFSLIETMIALGFLGVIVGGVLLKIDSIKSHIKQSEIILGLDHLESQTIETVGNRANLLYSVKRSNIDALKSCLLSETALCRDGSVFPISLYLEGQDQPISGPDIFFDLHGERCREECDGFRIETTVVLRCAGRQVCSQPAHTTVRYDIFYPSKGPEPVRRDFVDVREYSDGRFPNLNLQCASSQQVLRGIGINGEALCVARTEIKFHDEEDKKLEGSLTVSPKDCSALNQAAKDQFYVSGISGQGELQCAARYW